MCYVHVTGYTVGCVCVPDVYTKCSWNMGVLESHCGLCVCIVYVSAVHSMGDMCVCLGACTKYVHVKVILPMMYIRGDAVG